MQLSLQSRFWIKCAIAMAVFGLSAFSLSPSGEMLGVRTGPLLLIPGLLIYRFVWSDALAASNTPPSPLDLKISNWLFWIGLGLIIVLAYVL